MSKKKQVDLLSPEAIAMLRKDEHYYGDFGKQYLSNSDINILLTDPDLFRVGQDDNLEFLKGKYMHYKVLEPHRVAELPVVDVGSRNAKAYKDLITDDQPVVLLKSETEELDRLYDRLRSNHAMWHLLTAEANEGDFEMPVVGTLFGKTFKGKVDRFNLDSGLTIDLKTTRNLKSFEFNFYKYGYHTQAYIYKQLSLMDVAFVVISKEDGRIGYYHVSDYSLQRAEDDIERALEVYERYYGDNPSEDIEQYYTFKTI